MNLNLSRATTGRRCLMFTCLLAAFLFLAGVAQSRDTRSPESGIPKSNESEFLHPAAAKPDSAVSTHRNLWQEVRADIAQFFGVPEENINEETDLIEDLLADPMTAYEAVIRICIEQGVAPPEDAALTTVGDIYDHIWMAKDMPAEDDQEDVFTGSRGAVADSNKTAEDPRIHVQEVFYATSRRPEESINYSGQRGAKGKELSYGRCEVTIPIAVHKSGQMERPSMLKLEFKADPQKHIVLREVIPLDWETFKALLNNRIDQADGQDPTATDAFVFIHGFNVTFNAAARRTAQIAYDLAFPGPPLMFSWPSDGKLLAYFSDREDVEWSVPYIEQFFMSLKKQTNIRRLHLIAHSMGNQGLIRTLLRIALKHGVPEKPLFENVILAAPDFDGQAFTDQIAPQVVPLAKNWTVYASDKDRALDASTALAARRLGLPLSIASGVDTVDASGIEVTPWSVPEFHSYYASKKRAIRDLIGVLKGLAPVDRGLIPQVLGQQQYWKLPPK